MNHLTKNSLRIVHVDDVEAFVQITETFLKHSGFTQPIVRFNRGIKAVEYLTAVDPAHAPHVILLDLKMPGMSGMEVLRWLRNHYRERTVPVYILTSSESEEDQIEAMEAGATQYHYKTDLYSQLVKDLDQEIALYNHKHLEEMKQLCEIMAELALEGDYWADMVILTNTEGRIEWVNEPFVQACGYSLGELRGKKPGDLLQSPKSGGAAIEMIHHAVHTVSECDCRIINYRKDGSTYPVYVSLGPVFNHGTHEGFLAVEHDLSNEAPQESQDVAGS